MNDYGRRITISLEFEAAVGEVSRAICEEGQEVIARIDVRDHFWRGVGRNFRRYTLIEAWSPESALEALENEPDAGTLLPTTFAIYELPDGRTAIVAKDSLSPRAAEPDWRRDAPALAAIAGRESDRVGRVLTRLEHRSSQIRDGASIA
jgi:uncharacterized protein (DUF302 family)